MTYLPTYAHDEARTFALGFCCSECEEPFERAHHQPVVCGTCFRAAAIPALPRAIHPEVTKEFFRREAKRRKQRKSNGDS